MFIALIHVFLLKLVFNHETPVFLKEQGRDRELAEVLNKFYQPSEIKARLGGLTGGSDTNSNDEEVSGEVTLKQTFFDKRIRRAAWVGIGLATF